VYAEADTLHGAREDRCGKVTDSVARRQWGWPRLTDRGGLWWSAVFLIPGVVLLAMMVGMPPAGPAAAIQASPTAAVSTPIADEVLINARGLVPAAPESSAIYAIGGLSRSRDDGKTWESAGPLPPAATIIAAVDDPLLLLAGTYPSCRSTEGAIQELYRSTDGGDTWDLVTGEMGTVPLALWSRPQIALGANCAGLRISADTGQSWSALPLPEPGYEVSAFAPIAGIDPTMPAGLVVGTSEGGTSQLWRVDLTDPALSVISGSLATFWGGAAIAGRAMGSETESSELYVLGTANGVLVSHDGGGNWQESRLGLEDVTLSVDPTQGPIPDAELQRGFGITAVALDPNRPERIFAGTVNGLFVSIDGGATWRRASAVDGLISRLLVTSDGRRLFIQVDESVFFMPIDR
jgi:hypothetical protein